MKKTLLTSLLISLFVTVYAQDSLHMEKLSTWTSPNAVEYNDIWGYTSNGREYAIMGSDWGTHFIDVTNPNAPVEVNSFIGKTSSNVIWRDYKVSGTYAYGVCDGPGGSTLEIFDLSNLPTSVTRIYDEDSLSTNAHNIFIENDRIYLPSNRRGGVFYELDILSIADPTNPVLIGTMDANYFGGCFNCLHDIYVKDNIAFCSAGTSGLYVYDLTDLNNPVPLTDITVYTDQGYNHASWLNKLGDIVVFADETHNTALKICSLKFDKSELLELDTFKTLPGAIPHNPFIVGDEVYVSYYHDGMQVFNISNPLNVPKANFFYDTYPDNVSTDHSGFEGDWGVYPFFESKNIIASDITYGLNVLRKTIDVYTDQETLLTCVGETTSLDYFIDGTFNAGNTFTLELSNDQGWFDSPQVMATTTSTTAGTFTFTIPNIVGNKYKLRVKSSDPEVLQGTYTLLELGSCSGIKDLNKGNYLSIFPNPSNGKFTIENTIGLQTTIDILNSAGQVVKNINSSTSVDLELPSGIYTIKIQSKKGLQVEKLVID